MIANFQHPRDYETEQTVRTSNTYCQWLLLSRDQNMSLCFLHYHQSFIQRLRQYRKNRPRETSKKSFTSQIYFIIRRHLTKRLRKRHVTELCFHFVNYVPCRDSSVGVVTGLGGGEFDYRQLPYILS